MKNIHHHFSKIAHRYRELRTTDIEPILSIKKTLNKKTLKNLPFGIRAADVGCGAGRYDLALFQNLGEKLNFLYCIDANAEMLRRLSIYLGRHKIKKFQTVKSLARKLPLKNESLEAIFTFNAIHHFELLKFLKECGRVLKRGGYLFIYTRLRSQNRRNIWGRFFPLFSRKEKRLYELSELKRLFNKESVLKIQSLKFLKYARVSSLSQLINRATHHSYSTFYLYGKNEFKQSLEQFRKKLEREFRDLNKIKWFDENILLIIRKIPNPVSALEGRLNQ